MAFRSRSRRRASMPRKRAIWCNIPFGLVQFTESAGAQLLLTAEDWEAQFTSLANERAVLRAIVGNVTIQQTTVGTLGGTLFWGIYMTDANVTTTPVFTQTGMSEWDWLLTGCRPTSSSVTATAQQSSLDFVNPINIKAKRRMTSQDEIRIVFQYAADVAAPAGVAGGLLRFLVARD